MEQYLTVHICENNCYCQRTRRIRAVQFYTPDQEMIVHFEAKDIAGVPAFSNERMIEIYGCRVKCTMSIECCGNMLWNLYTMPLNYGLGFLQLIRSRGEFIVSDHLTTLQVKLYTGAEIVAGDLGWNNVVAPFYLPCGQKSLWD